uniref:Uncharacterized protein n=1 Tax=Pan troglodytes TaxID=9598 RepID=G2HHP2_PANTR|nr:hypothetical protein [Pan troglodytes]
MSYKVYEKVQKESKERLSSKTFSIAASWRRQHLSHHLGSEDQALSRHKTCQCQDLGFFNLQDYSMKFQ